MSSIIEKKSKKQILKIKKPPLYNIILHNDDVTTFEFVILILIEIFNKNHEEATLLTIQIHEQNKAIVATYPYEIAITKKQITDVNSKRNNFPLVCSLEQE